MFCQECDGKENKDTEAPRERLLKEYDPCLSAATESDATFSHELDAKDMKKFYKLLRDEKARTQFRPEIKSFLTQQANLKHILKLFCPNNP